jgi:hypothetical protein
LLEHRKLELEDTSQDDSVLTSREADARLARETD